MRLDADPALRGLLSTSEARAFAAHLGVPVASCGGETLRALVRAFLGRVPFQNVTMLARPRRSPTADEIVGDVLAGRGGPCGVMNPFFAALLHRLGFDVCLFSGSMQQPDCHIALGVRIDGREHWLDVGNGHPYLEPVALGDEALRAFGGLCYRVLALGGQDEGRYAVEHQVEAGGAWRRSYSFAPVPRSFSAFGAMIERHYSSPGYGPFLGGLRLIRCPGGVTHALRDRVLLINDGVRAVRSELTSRAMLDENMKRHFGDLQLPLDEALAALAALGVPLFPGLVEETDAR